MWNGIFCRHSNKRTQRAFDYIGGVTTGRIAALPRRAAMDRDAVRRVMQNWRVVAVDDDVESLLLLQRCLRMNGAETYTALNAYTGIDLIIKVQPDIVLADLSMPVMSGWEMLKLIRADQRIKRVPVVAVTAHALGDVRERVLAAGFDGYFAKPLIPRELMAGLVGIWEHCASVGKIAETPAGFSPQM
jgi:CheY-like chemotaxis protein